MSKEESAEESREDEHMGERFEVLIVHTVPWRSARKRHTWPTSRPLGWREPSLSGGERYKDRPWRSSFLHPACYNLRLAGKQILISLGYVCRCRPIRWPVWLLPVTCQHPLHLSWWYSVEEKYHRMRREIVGCTRHANSLCKDRKWPRTSSTENADKCKKEAEELLIIVFLFICKADLERRNLLKCGTTPKQIVAHAVLLSWTVNESVCLTLIVYNLLPHEYLCSISMVFM